MLDRRNFTKIVIPLLSFLVLAQPAIAHACSLERRHSYHYKYKHDRHHRHHHAYPPYGKAVFTLPGDFVKVIVGGRRYHYCDGVYYEKASQGYVVVPPPQGIAYENPKVLVSNVSDSVTVHIPNAAGGHTSVALKRWGGGFLGPQGEFYSEFPSTEQLKVVYGK